MKKFTKGCLITALVLFVLGWVMIGVFGLLGGLRQLEELDGINGIPFTVNHNGIYFSFFDDEGSDEDMWDDGDAAWERISAEQEAVRLDGEIKNLDLDIGACAFYIRESDDDYAQIGISGDDRDIRYAVKGNTLKVASRKYNRFLFWHRDVKVEAAQVVLSLPKNMELDTVDIEFGAGSIEAIPLNVNSIEVEIGGGKCKLEGVTANQASLHVGAGTMTVGSLSVREADVEVGAGELIIPDMNITGVMELEAGMGSAWLNGTITGDMNAECGMGNLEIELTGSESDHDYEIECAMGTAEIGKNSYSGLANERYVQNGSDSHFKIDCAMGNVVIQFKE